MISGWWFRAAAVGVVLFSLAMGLHGIAGAILIPLAWRILE